MAWLRIHLTEEQQRVVNEERSVHPNPRIRGQPRFRGAGKWVAHSAPSSSRAHSGA
jgi:hypothetical protein